MADDVNSALPLGIGILLVFFAQVTPDEIDCLLPGIADSCL